jgi:hypothetical protein
VCEVEHNTHSLTTTNKTLVCWEINWFLTDPKTFDYWAIGNQNFKSLADLQGKEPKTEQTTVQSTLKKSHHSGIRNCRHFSTAGPFLHKNGIHFCINDSA